MKAFTIYLFTASFLMFNSFLNAQTKIEKEIFEDGEYFFAQDDYAEALTSYLKLYKYGYQENANINYRLGVCYLQSNIDRDKAVTYLEKAVKNVSDKYVEGSLKENSAPMDVYLFMGNAYRNGLQFDKAIEAYNLYITNAKKANELDKSYAKAQIEACGRAKEAIKSPLRIKITPLGRPINTNAANYNPIISQDENYIVYVTRLKLYDAIMVSEKNSGKWSNPINITPDIQSDGDQYPVFLSADRNVLLLCKRNNNNSDIYESTFDGKVWLQSRPLNKEINTKYWESHACISNDGKTLYFTSNRPQSLGGTDIFYSELNAKGEWGSAQNIGSEINTTFNEETPYISLDGKRLYFSSQGHESIGGYDVFYSDKDENGKWGKPVNLGYPVNTTDDDLFYVPVKNGTVAYQAKDLKKAGIGDLDIARIEIFSKAHPFKYGVQGNLTGLVKNLKTDQVKLKLYDPATKQFIDSVKADESGKYSFKSNVIAGNYNVQLASNKLTVISKEFAIPEDYPNDNYSVDNGLFDITPDVNEKLALESSGSAKKSNEVVTESKAIHNILFPFNGAALTEDANNEVNNIIEIMKKNPSLVLEVIGYTDSWGREDYNLILSEKRAKAVKDKIKSKGISITRLKSKGKGMADPIAINENTNGTDNPEGRAFNRRVEFKISKSDNADITIVLIAVPENLKVK